MKALKLPFLWIIRMLIPAILFFACAPAATTLHNSGNFSNIRSEIRLTDGSVLKGYASHNAMNGENALRVRVAGQKSEYMIPLSKIDRLYAEEHEFVVKWLNTPKPATRNGMAATTRAMVKRIGMENDPVQVYEYKYPVSNPKSPIDNIMTAWFVSFPGDPDDLPLVEFNSAAYRQKWAKLTARNQDGTAGLEKAPSSVKSLLEEVRKLPAEASGFENFGAAE
jgi:hypothetical protein